MRLLTHSVLVQIIIGALITAFVPFASTIEKFLSFTNLSVIGLFMMVGLEIQIKKFTSDLALCAQLVLITTIIPMLLFLGISWAFHLDTLTALTISVVLTTTGTGVTIQTLSNMNMLTSRTGQFLVLVSALDDVPAAIFMVILVMNAPAASQGASLNYMFLAAAAVSFVMNFLVKNKWVLSIMILAFAISFAKFLEALHISTVMGGLIAGFMLNFALKEKTKGTNGPIKKILAPILPFYMIFIGLKLSPAVLNDLTMVMMTIIFTIVGVSSKWGCTYYLMRERKDLSADCLAWGMVPRGIPGFAFASLAVTRGLISQDIFTMLVMVVSVSTWIGLFGLEMSLNRFYKDKNGENA